MTSLPEPKFIDRDPVAVTTELISTYEAMTGRTLQPAQLERVLIDLIAYVETLLRISIQETAKQNMVAYATGVNLDHLGKLLGVVRLPSTAASTVLEVTLSEALGDDLVVPAGTRVKTKDGSAVFATDKNLVVATGATTGTVTATATDAGAQANGYLPGQVIALMDPIPGVARVNNISTTYGGAATEDDDRLRRRVQEAPERFSVAGPSGAYRWHAMTAHQSITEASVVSPSPGVVQIFPLTKDGIPAPELIDEITAYLTDEKVRPLTDQVSVLAPTEVTYTIEATLTLLRGADQVSVEQATAKAAEAYAEARRAGLGRDIVPSQVIAALSVPGVYRVGLVNPAERVLDVHEWANCTGITLTIAGVADG